MAEPNRAHVILGIAAPEGGDEDLPDGHMSPEEQEMHGEASMKEMWDAMQKGDFKSAFHAMRAAASCAEPDGDEYDHGEPEGEEPEGGE